MHRRMRMTDWFCCLALIAVPADAMAQDKSPIMLAKTSKWEINYDADACHLAARFGEGDQAIVMRMTRYALVESFDLTLTGDSLAIQQKFPGFDIGFAPTAKLQRQPAMSGATSTNQPLVMVKSMRLDNLEAQVSQKWKPGDQTMPPPVPAEREAAVTGLEFRIGASVRHLATGPMSGPMEALRTCTFDLIRTWGFDPHVQSTLSRRSVPNSHPGYWATTNDYPAKALSQKINGIVQFRLDVDESGKVTGCRVLARTSPDTFGNHTCNLMRMRAKMTGALDQYGNPVKSYYVGAVRWVVPVS